MCVGSSKKTNSSSDVAAAARADRLFVNEYCLSHQLRPLIDYEAANLPENYGVSVDVSNVADDDASEWLVLIILYLNFFVYFNMRILCSLVLASGSNVSRTAVRPRYSISSSSSSCSVENVCESNSKPDAALDATSVCEYCDTLLALWRLYIAIYGFLLLEFLNLMQFLFFYSVKTPSYAHLLGLDDVDLYAYDSSDDYGGSDCSSTDAQDACKFDLNAGMLL